MDGPALPLAVDTATLVLGVGTLAFLVVAYDIYRRYDGPTGGT